MRMRIHSTHEIDTKYELRSDTMPIDNIALKATPLPRLMRERSAAIMNETKVAFSGMS